MIEQYYKDLEPVEEKWWESANPEAPWDKLYEAFPDTDWNELYSSIPKELLGGTTNNV